ncbi:MAG: DUF5063 domain-containing protein [Proteiniphilum sp.]|jgi:hypothetical protein|nr:DUF5063 domain-containing protein [Proteiniphilum sp.]NCB23945.1 DUF5063 domain-containing protein [Bacteroidia bacterium]MDD2937092.1 DUF5063 domain-containing protein [Proteiniphilum sp.]MDD3077213.1 DUF5063 domain-containing protein [Proteiniphilum sp.]MDD3778996.1 DUF5063 domain-containing protein [Proteiniphilum sp.]
MLNKNNDEPIYLPAVIEFVTIAVELSSFLEKEESVTREEWIDRILKILPLLYVKASLLPDSFPVNDEPPATFVREEDYIRVVTRVAAIMGEEDIYLDVFVDEMKYSDTPVRATISEDIADIYQDVRNFVSVYQFELTDQMQDAIHVCKENFRLFWGQKLVNVLRPLHALKTAETDGEENYLNGEDLWD